MTAVIFFMPYPQKLAPITHSSLRYFAACQAVCQYPDILTLITLLLLPETPAIFPSFETPLFRGLAVTSPKWVYAFGNGKAEGSADMRNLLGGKGAGLAEMSNLGLPVPPGFTITTEVCTHYYAQQQFLSG